MLKTVEKLASTSKDMRRGNHSSTHCGGIALFEFHDAVICIASYDKKEFKFPYDGEWADSRSTKRTVNSYKEYFEKRGFILKTS